MSSCIIVLGLSSGPEQIIAAMIRGVEGPCVLTYTGP
jgi:hypothetical protein